MSVKTNELQILKQNLVESVSYTKKNLQHLRYGYLLKLSSYTTTIAR